MPTPAITDRSLRTAYKTLERTIGAGKSATLDDLTALLAKVADRSGLSMTSAETQIKNAVSTQERMSIVREGMSAAEKKDLESILDGGDVALTADARKFLEQLVGRTPVNPTSNGPVNITDMKLVNGKVQIAGTAKPNVT